MVISRARRLGLWLQDTVRFVFIMVAVALAVGAGVAPMVFLLRRLGVG